MSEVSLPLSQTKSNDPHRYDPERLSGAVWEVLDRPVDDVVAHVQALVPGAPIEGIANEYITTIKIGLAATEANDLDYLLPLMFEEEKMEVWRRIGLIGGAIL